MVDRSLTLGTLFTANVREFIQKVDLIKKKVGELNATMASVGKQAKGFDQASKSVDKIDKSMGRAGKTTTSFTHRLGLVGVAMDRVTSAAKTTAAFFAAGLGIGAVTRGLQAGTKEIIDFDQALKNLQAITKATDADVAGMGEVIKQVAEETKFSTGEVAEGMVLLGQAGFSVQEAMQAMASVANLATGTLSDMKLTSDLLTTTIRAFNLSTVESARVADVMANAINRSKLTIDKLRIAFNFVGAAAAQAGLSLEETAGSMMVLANNGLRASTIGTGLRQVMSRLLAPNRKLREEFKEQGIALEKVNPATQGWSNALKNLLPILVNTETGVVNMAKAYQLFGLRGAQAAAILARAVASGDYQRMIEFTMEVGSAARMAGTQMEGLGVKLKNLADRLKLIAVAIGEAGLTDALKVLIDTLRGLAKVVADFIRSDVGSLVVAFAGWSLAIYGVVKAFNILLKVIGLVGTAVKGRFLTSLAAVGISAEVASSSFGKLALSLVKTIGSFLKVGLVVGGVVTVIRYFVTSIERQIGKLEQFDAKTQTVIQTLGLYSSKLEDLIEKKEKDEDVTKEHSKLIERFGNDIKQLEKDYGKLDIALEDNTESLEENLEAINNLQKAELEKSILQNIELIDQYGRQIERTNFWLATWNFAIEDTIGWLNNLKMALNLLGQRIIDTAGNAFELLIRKLERIGPISRATAEALKFFERQWANLWTVAEQKLDQFIAKYSGHSAKVEQLTEAQRQAFVRAAKGLDLLGRGTRSIESIVEELETLSGKKIDTKGIEAINNALKKVTVTIEEQKEKWNETFDDLPSVFKEMYDKMDTIRKADFAKVLRRMASEEAAFEDLASKMGIAEEERYAGIANIRSRHLRDFEEDQAKEVKVNQDAIDAMLANLDYFVEGTNEAYDKRSQNALNYFLEEYDSAAKSKDQLIQLEEQFSTEMEQIAKEREQRLGSLGKDRNRVLQDLERQTVKEITKLNEKMYKDLQDQLRNRLESAKKELASLQGDLTDLEKTHREEIRGINQLTMTDEQKWLDDRREAHYLFNQALETNDKDYFKQARQLAAGLAREVQNDQGEVVRTIDSTARTARNLLGSIQEEQRFALERAITKRKEDVRSLEKEISSLGDKLLDIQNKIKSINSTELRLRMDESLRRMKEMFNVTSKFKSDWDALNSKVITLTVKYQYQGGPPPTTKPVAEQEASETAARMETERWGGLIKRKLGGAVSKVFEVGGRLRGYGGGDKVKALLEPGEFVVRKEAVAKYGENLFSSLNSMKSGAESVGEAVAQRIGGMIGKMTPAPAVQAYGAGGGVSSSLPPRTINVYLQPKFLTGDRRAMRVAAVEIQKALVDLDSRWGKR